MDKYRKRINTNEFAFEAVGLRVDLFGIARPKLNLRMSHIA